jgi:hypothetical protein
MSDDTFSASDFTSAETSLSSDAPASAAPVEASAPVETAAQPGEATTQPAAIETTSPSTEPAKPAGPIPFDVHKTALENARIKATQEALAQFDQQYGWAKQVDRGELEHALTVARKLNVGAGPEAFISGLQELLTDGQRDPQIAAALRSFQGKALAQLRQQQAQPDQEPQFLLESADGSVRFDPQAFQQWKQWNEQRVLSQVEQKLQPLQQAHQQTQEQQARVARAQQVEHFTTTTFADLQTWPGMESQDARAAVAKELAAARIDPDDPREVQLALNAAYRKAVLPTLHTASRQAVLNDINRQAAASTVNPAQTSTRAPKSMADMSIAEALQFVAAQQA